MKKIIYTLLVAVLALSFMGCPTVYEDLSPVGSLDGIFLRGSMNNWGTESPVVASETAGYYSVQFIATDTSHDFKFANEGWSVQYSQHAKNSTFKTSLAGVSFDKVDDKNGGFNDLVKGLTKGKAYKFEIIAGPTSIESTLVEGTMEAPVYPTPFYLDGLYFVGCPAIRTNNFSHDAESLLWNPSLDKETGILTYTIDFTAKTCTDNWHEGAPAVFKLANKDWKGYSTSELKFGADYKKLEESTDNAKMTGIEAGKSYRLYVRTSPDGKVEAKVVLLNTANIKVNVTGLPEEANDKVMYLTGDYFDWTEPGEDNATIKGTVADGAVSYSFDYIYEGTTFELKVTGKAAAAGWKKPEISGPDGKDASFTVNQEKTTVTVTYVETKEITSADTDVEKDWGLQYRCKWEVK